MFEGRGASEARAFDDDDQRYPEVRGLRFCPEKRLYLDRDRESAITIARLRTQALLGRKRPAPFHRSCRTPGEVQDRQINRRGRRQSAAERTPDPTSS